MRERRLCKGEVEPTPDRIHLADTRVLVKRFLAHGECPAKRPSAEL
jgi:hypothetical protein